MKKYRSDWHHFRSLSPVQQTIITCALCMMFLVGLLVGTVAVL